jgi:hypothetical protein
MAVAVAEAEPPFVATDVAVALAPRTEDAASAGINNAAIEWVFIVTLLLTKTYIHPSAAGLTAASPSYTIEHQR